MKTPGAEAWTRPEWMTIHEAAALIGVSAATMRRWADAGEVRSFTTPGGHRRFSRSAISRLLPAETRTRPRLARIGEDPARMARVYRAERRRTLAWMPWIDGLDDGERTRLREHGQRIAALMLESFDAPDAETRASAVATAEASAEACGRIAGQNGVGMRETVEAFLRFRTPFVRELGAVARRRGLDTEASTRLLDLASETVDRLLCAALRGHAEAASQPAAAQGTPA